MAQRPVLKIIKSTITRLMWCDECETAAHDAGECQKCESATVEIGWYETAGE